MSDDGQGTRRADVRLPFVPADNNEVLPEPVHDRVEDETPANDEAKPLGKSQPQPAANGMNGNGSGNGSDTGTDIGTGTHNWKPLIQEDSHLPKKRTANSVVTSCSLLP